MKVDLITAPPPLRFGEGENRFALFLKKITGTERAKILDACMDRRFAAIEAAILPIVIAWDNVTDASGVPLQFESINDHREKVSHLDEFLGALPVKLHMECIVGILAFIGVPRKDLDGMAQAFADLGGTEIDANPTKPPAESTAASAATS